MTDKTDDAISRLEKALHEDRQNLTRAFQAFRDNLSVGAVVAEGSDLAKAAISEGTQKARAVIGEKTERARAALGEKAEEARAALGEGVDRAQNFLVPKLEEAKEKAVAHPLLLGAAGLGVSYFLLKVLSGGSAAPEVSDNLEEEPWLAEADKLRDRAAALLAKIDDAIEKGVASAEELEESREEVLSALTTSVRDLMGRDLGDLAEDLREKTIKAREEAYALWISTAEEREAEVEAQSGSNNALLIAALVAAGGVALAALMPRTKFEENLIGDLRSRVGGALKGAAKDVEKASPFSHDLVESVFKALTKA